MLPRATTEGSIRGVHLLFKYIYFSRIAILIQNRRYPYMCDIVFFYIEKHTHTYVTVTLTHACAYILI